MADTLALRAEAITGTGQKKRRHAVPIEDDALVLHELSEVWLLLDADSDASPAAFLGELALPWDAAQRGFLLDKTIIAQWVGGNELVVRAGERERSLWVTVEPHPKKAKPRLKNVNGQKIPCGKHKRS